MPSYHGYNQASFRPSNLMSESPSTNHPPSPPSPWLRTGFSHRADQSSASTHGNGYRPYDSFYSDSDSSSKDSPASPAFDRRSPYSDNPKLNTVRHLENKNSRRVYFDYGITTSSHPDSLSPTSKFEDTQDIETARRSPLQSYTHLITPTFYTFPWELPSPSISRTVRPHRADNDKDFHTESPSFYHSQPFWLGLYFCFNLGLTLYNKAVLIHFPYAYALTALHALCGSIGGFTLFRLGVYVPAKLSDADNMALVAFSLLYTINIAVSNLSLELVTIPVSPINGHYVSLLKLGTYSLVPPGRPSSYPDIYCSPFNVFIRCPE